MTHVDPTNETALVPILQPYVDATMISCFRSCPRKFFNEFVLGLRPPGLSVDLHAGGAFAHALEVVRKHVFLDGLSLGDALLRANAAFEIYWGDFVIPESKKTNKRPDRVWAAVEEYFTKFPPLTDHIQPYFSDGKPTFEFTFAVPLEPTCKYPQSKAEIAYEGVKWPVHPVSGDPFLYTGRFDLLGEYMGVPIIVDDKTSGTSQNANWAESWDLRSQFIGYTWACGEMGIPADQVAVRGVGILMRDIPIAEAIKPYSNHLRAAWLEQLRRDLWRIVTMYREGYWDYNFAESCTSYGNCIFIQPCQSPTPDPWLKTMSVRRWNPLLKDPTKDAT